MTDHTHYYLLAGDGHIRGRRGPAPMLIDPVLGQVLTTVLPPSPAPTANTVVRGVTSGAWGRVIRVLSSNAWVIESWSTTITVPPGVPVTGPGASFVPSEVVNFDNGATGHVMPFGQFQSLPQQTQFAHELRDARVNTPVPEDRVDTVFWDRHAKYSRSIVLDGTTIGPTETSFVQGARFTTSGGASGTILLGNVVGSDYQIQIIRAAGTFSVGDVLTVTVTGHTATIKTVGAEPPTGTWVSHDILPNNAGTNSLWEFPPNGNGTDGGEPSIGPEATLLRLAFDKHRASGSMADRGTRLVPFSTFDDFPQGSADSYLGGVTLQTVRCSGTFPTTWQAGETVSCGGWSAKVHGFSATNKYLFVYDVNGATLAGGTITGASSAASATCTGPAIGWQQGSAYFNNLMAQVTAAQAAAGALYSGSAAQWEGLALMFWEAEVAMFGTAVGASWPSFERMQGQWIRCITAIRAALAAPDVPVAIWRNDIRSHGTSVQMFGVPFAGLLQQVIDTLPKFLSKVRVFTSDGMEPAQTTPLPTTAELVFLRTQDYPELGRRAWRALEFGSVVIPAGNFEPLPLLLIAGQSQAVSGIPWQLITIDKDPDLYSSALFATATGNTIDLSVLNFRCDTLQWEPYDVYYGNTFFGQGPGTFGIEAPLAYRMKKRFAVSPAVAGEIGIIKVAVGASSVNANCGTALATFDPDGSERLATTASCTVTVLAATSLLPARGRFTATAGTFSSWVVGQTTVVTGSALGFQGFGGNNTAPYRGTPCRAVAPDGSYVEIEGTFVAEGPRSFTLTMGPLPLVQEVESVIRVAFEKCVTQLRRIPKPVAKIWWNGESDLEKALEYQAALDRVLAWLEDIFGQRHKGEQETATCILELTPNTPFDYPDASITAVIEAQRAIAAALPNAVSVSTAKLPLESSGTFPRTHRLHNGVHHTVRGFLMAGYLADEALGTLEGIPAHPEGAAAVDFGTDGSGGVFTDGADSVVGVDEVGGVDTPGDLVVEDGTGLPNAESYASVAFADTFWSKNGAPTFWTGSTLEQKEVALRKATREGIDGLFGGMFRGCIQFSTQRLQFPRYGCYDDDGRLVAYGTVPWQVQEATALLAGDVRAGDTLLPTELDRGAVARETKKGVGFEKTIEYVPGGSAGSVKRRRVAEAMLWPLLRGSELGVSRA